MLVYRFLILILFTGFLSACGQTGNLYLPDKSPNEVQDQ
jgi:predicted small lipoprotein YifL